MTNKIFKMIIAYIILAQAVLYSAFVSKGFALQRKNLNYYIYDQTPNVCVLEVIDCSEESRHVSESFPSSPTQFQIETKTRNTHLLTWKPPDDGTNDNLSGFWLKVSSISRMWNATCYICNFDNIISSQHLITQEFGVRDTQTLYELYSLPMSSKLPQYEQRIVIEQRSNHSSSDTVDWSPNLIIINNESCANQIAIEFDLPPKTYPIDFIRFFLISSGNTISKKELRISEVNAEKGSIIYRNVDGGKYSVKMFHQSLNSNCKCVRKGLCCDCSYINVATFTMISDQSKCSKPASQNKYWQKILSCILPLGLLLFAMYKLIKKFKGIGCSGIWHQNKARGQRIESTSEVDVSLMLDEQSRISYIKTSR